jgi:hypothetical protein
VVQTVQNLVLAKLEGLSVRVLLNRDYAGSFLNRAPDGGDRAVSLLESSGIPVEYVAAEHRIHSNIVVIDRRHVVEGSQPWVSGLDPERNFYTNTEIVSEAHARAVLERINRLSTPKGTEAGPTGRQTFPVLSIPRTLFEGRKLERLCRSREPAAFDLYLWLIAKYAKRPRPGFTVSFSRLAQKVFSETRTKIGAARELKAAMKRLEKTGLIEAVFQKDRNVGVRIVLPGGDEAKTPIGVPANFFRFRYPSLMDNLQKAVYLYLLERAGRSDRFPLFTLSREEVEAFGVADPAEFRKAVVQLEKGLLIESQGVAGESGRSVPGYRILNPPDRKALGRDFDVLVHQYGAKRVKEAQILASQLNKEADPSVVRDILYFTGELGLVAVQKILYTISHLPEFHPRRNFEQVKKQFAGTLNRKLNPEG